MPNLPLLKIWREMRRAGQIYVSHGKRLNLRRYLDLARLNLSGFSLIIFSRI
ncbi:hypothetical protein CAMRE0001_3281 [Campylobacter rectus RM3267]|uniref:Uncharacterized protein n=1 Tax=Campylobacter rectus RM3267 TaxID=553218 RepID=B9D5U7_CAMRE|nr:hypothetical protein CAMRE0001_3281 [Campylobacter rectus RM3267]